MLKEGVACAWGRMGGVAVTDGGHQSEGPSLPSQLPGPHNTQAFDAAEDKPGLSPLNSSHTPLAPGGPWRPCQGLALCLGSSPGRQATARGGRPSVLRYLFIYLKGPAFTYTGSDYPQGREEGDALPGPLMFQRRDGEMALGVTAAVGCVLGGAL